MLHFIHYKNIDAPIPPPAQAVGLATDKQAKMYQPCGIFAQWSPNAWRYATNPSINTNFIILTERCNQTMQATNLDTPSQVVSHKILNLNFENEWMKAVAYVH